MYKTFKTTSYLTIFLLVFSFAFPVNSFADWDDKSDELPGMDTDYTLVYIAGALLVATLVVLVVNSGDDSAEEADKTVVAPDSSASAQVFQVNRFSMAAVQANTSDMTGEFSILPYAGIKRTPKMAGYKNNKDLDSFVVGVAVSF